MTPARFRTESTDKEDLLVKPFEWARRRRTGAILAVGTAGSLLFMAAGPASGATHQPSAKVAVPQGIGAAALKNAGVFTPGSTPETVAFILKARNRGALEAQVEGGMRGGFLSVSRFARNFGQTPVNISALENYLAKFGIATSAYADRLDVTATGTADQFNQALSVRQHEFTVPAVPASNGHPGRPAMKIHGTTQSPLLPRSLARFVQAILGLSNYPTAASNAVRRPALAKGVKPSVVQTGALTPEDFAKQYNLTPLQKVAKGKGVTIGIVTLASVDPATPEFFWSNILDIKTKANRITLDNVDGGSGPVSDASGSGETTLDVEQSGALAPQSNIVVYQAPNTDVGFVDGFYTAASQNIADTVSSSWGESETLIQAEVASGLETPAYADSFDNAFLEFAAQGQSAFVSAGDFGAYTAFEDIGTTNLSAGNPDSSPWITTAGGTTLPGTIPLTATDSATIPAERTWGWDWLDPHFADFIDPATGLPFTSEAAFATTLGVGGTGGGFSVFEPTPGYQQGVPSAHRFSATEYLTPIDPMLVAPGITLPTAWNFNPDPAVITGSGTGRATPDVSADADPFTGYLLYFTFGDAPATLEAGWGGTSFVAPQLNGSTAVIDSLLGHRIGFWNTSIYRSALRHNSPFTPLDTASNGNTNLFYTGTAGHVFNVGSGLGTPNLTRLAGTFAR
jgi:kumamolisin